MKGFCKVLWAVIGIIAAVAVIRAAIDSLYGKFPKKYIESD